MKRLLIVITRMYALQGDANDEFVNVWHGGATAEHRVFTLQKGAHYDCVLVLHGYEYPQNVALAAERARASVEGGLAKVQLLPRLRQLRTGFVFHPRQSWTPDAQRRIADDVTAWLRGAEAAVDFAESFRHGSVLERRLAPACVERSDWTPILGAVWAYFLKPTMARYEERMGDLVHRLQGVLLPLRNDLDTWRRGKLDDQTGHEILRENKQQAPTALARVRSLVLDEGDGCQSIAALMWEVADKLDEGSKEALIGDLAELEKLFAESDPRYQRAAALLRAFAPEEHEGDAQDEPAGETRLAALRAHLADANPLDIWFQALQTALANLRRAWAK